MAGGPPAQSLPNSRMTLDVLPTRQAGAAANMATDFLLLQRYPEPGCARFRHYGWHRPAFTFGYGQKIGTVRGVLTPEDHPELCRRPTGGGIVDHRNDWTYSLVIPRGHPLEESRATEAYRSVHACICAALRSGGIEAALKDSCDPHTPGAACGAPGVCFSEPELHDVLLRATGKKVAGAAMKRNKHGLLLQGSVARGPLPPAFDWDSFQAALLDELQNALQMKETDRGWPEFAEEELAALVDQYSSPEWNEFR